MEIKPLWWKMLVLIGGVFIAAALFLSLGSPPKEIEEKPSISGFAPE